MLFSIRISHMRQVQGITTTECLTLCTIKAWNLGCTHDFESKAKVMELYFSQISDEWIKDLNYSYGLVNNKFYERFWSETS